MLVQLPVHQGHDNTQARTWAESGCSYPRRCGPSHVSAASGVNVFSCCPPMAARRLRQWALHTGPWHGSLLVPNTTGRASRRASRRTCAFPHRLITGEHLRLQPTTVPLRCRAPSATVPMRLLLPMTKLGRKLAATPKPLSVPTQNHLGTHSHRKPTFADLFSNLLVRYTP
jgi:hypothetical protein